MFGTLVTAAKAKALFTALSLILLSGALFEIGGEQATQNIGKSVNNVDPFTQDIQARSDLVYNTVSEVINTRNERGTIAYKQTCESSISFIQKEKLDTEAGYNTLDAGQKELINNYREYLKEAAYVVSVCYSGDEADLTRLNELKNNLN